MTMGPLHDDDRWRVDQADAVEWLRALPDGYLDLLVTSPPYERARLYLENGEDMKIARDTETWVAWLVEVAKEAVRACKGLCVFVVEGQTRNFRWTAGPALLMADLHRAGLNLRKPPAFCRVGIPGSGGPDWWRNDWEFCVCVTRPGKLPWSDATAMGHPPKWAPGGEMSHRVSDGKRVNQWGPPGSKNGFGKRFKRGKVATSHTPRPSHNFGHNGDKSVKGAHKQKVNETPEEFMGYQPPTLANPGNLIKCVVGGGLIGDKLAHDNEAPFPERLVEYFVRSFCPPGGITGDCFSGSGTTPAVAVRCGRRALACDLRRSQVELSRKRIGNVTTELFT